MAPDEDEITHSEINLPL